MEPLDVVRMSPIMKRTGGRPEVVIGLIDGPVDTGHPGLAGRNLSILGPAPGGACIRSSRSACEHGTFIAGMLAGNRGSNGQAICPDCTYLIRPIFSEVSTASYTLPAASLTDLAAAIVDCVRGGARILNLSFAVSNPSAHSDRTLEEVLNWAARRNVLIVAAAGNQSAVGGSAILSHPAVIPAGACDLAGQPMAESNLSNSLGRRGLMAPGSGVKGLGMNGNTAWLGGTSVAAPFITGALALLWSIFPSAGSAEIASAVTRFRVPARRTIVPPLLDAWAAYETLLSKRRAIQ